MLVVRWMLRRPVTVLCCVVVIVLSIVGFASSTYDWGWQLLATGQDDVFRHHRWWGLITAFLAVDGGGALVFVVPFIVVVVGAAERLMGSWRTVIVYVGGSAASGLIGFALSWVESTYLGFLPLNAPSIDALSPATGVICAATAASSFASALWRRRMRLGASFFAVTFFLYSGGAGDFYSLVAVPVGLVLGFVLGGSRSGFRLVRSSHHEIRALLAAVVALSTLGPVVAALIGSGSGLLSIYGLLAVDVDHPRAALLALLPVAVGVVAAWGILRGRRAALWLAVGLFLLMSAVMVAVFVVIQPETMAIVAEESNQAVDPYIWQTLTGSALCAILPLVGAALLIALRRHVDVRTSLASARRFVIITASALTGAAVLSFVGMLSIREQFRPAIDALDLLRALPLRLVPPTFVVSDGLAFVPATRWAYVLWSLPPALLWIAVLVASCLLIFSRNSVVDDDDRLRARAILERGGGHTLSFMTTWPGNSFWFDPQTDAAVAYRVQGFVAVAVGGPFGPAYTDARVVERFVRFCGDRGWTATFYGVDDAALDSFAALRWQRLKVAEEAILRPLDWNPTGKKWQDIRTAVNKAERAGVVARWISWRQLSLPQKAQIQAISEAWVAEKNLPEMGFTLGGLDELADPSVRLMLAVDAGGSIVAVTSWLPLYGSDGGGRAPRVSGYTLDFMRRRPDAANGTMEFVIAATVEQAKADGLELLSLSGAPLANAAPESSSREASASVVAQLLDYVGRSLEPAYGFRSLLNFKKKFQPEFVPLWLIYPDTTDLPAVGAAVGRCYLPQLSVLHLSRLLRDLRPKAIPEVHRESTS
ncbi:bifunctional lysylphosphatidylglycerol flippase/synthetase MprF [Agreia sp.]|uniref:bifunctional lysylphosphatidylglycerol flippase/synthetase MprF n=1 Tax=Agreia sp. TaxID=1872416 RepID=UPI0035BBD2B0